MKLFEVCNRIEDELKSKNLTSGVQTSNFNPISNSKNIEFEYNINDKKKIIEIVRNIILNQPYTVEYHFLKHSYILTIKNNVENLSYLNDSVVMQGLNK